MKNFIQPGEAITLAAPYDLLSGAGAKVGSIFGVAAFDALNGVDVVLQRSGVFSLAKVSAQAWAVGDPLYWDNSAKLVTNVKGANLYIGKALEVAANPTAKGKVLLGGADGVRMASGQHTTVAAADTIATGLALVSAVIVSMDDDPVDGVMHVTATIGDQAGAPAAGSIIIKGWKSTDADATLIAATTFGKKVNWIAIGQ